MIKYIYTHAKRGEQVKFIMEQSLDCKETEIKVTYALLDDRLKRLIEQIKLYSFSIMAEKDGITVPIALEDVYYFDSVDNKTFLYFDKDVYRYSKKLYELEDSLSNTSFVRISKSCILNTSVVASVQAQFSGRIEATLKNNEKLIISKHYIKSFRDKFVL
jgi:Response regulator of the LytR/AlgR family